MREKLLAWTLVGLLLGVTGRVTATTAEVQTVEGVSAIVRHNQAAARTQAIHSALRKALEDTVAALLESSVPTAEQRTLETHLYAHSEDFIRSYRVLWEYPDTYQQVYRVQLEAEVAAREVAEALGRLGLTQAGDSESERVMILVAEHHLERPQESVSGRDDGVAAGVLRAQLQAHGLRPVRPEVGAPWDGSLGSALVAARQAGAELVLVGQADVRPLQRGVSGVSEHAMRATVWVQVVRTASGLEVATEQGEAITMYPDAMVGGAQALEQAAREVATRVLTSLQRARQSPQDYSGSSYRPR